MTKHAAKQTKLQPVTEGFRADEHLPVIPVKFKVTDAISASAHAHPRGQLIYASHGVIRVITPVGTWLVPPTQAIWITPNIEHDVTFPGEVVLFSLFVANSKCHQLLQTCAVLKVTALLRELIIRACDLGDKYQAGSASYRFMMVLIDEIARADITEIELPAPKNLRLVKVTDALSSAPQATPDYEQLAELACVSARTLARLFIQETGMSMGEWNRRLLVHQAISQLTSGKSVTTVALNLGYKNPTSFVEMFRKTLGVSPKRYLLRIQNQGVVQSF